MGPPCLSWRLLKHFSRRDKQTTFVAIGGLRVKLTLQIQQSLNCFPSLHFIVLTVDKSLVGNHNIWFIFNCTTMGQASDPMTTLT